MKLTINLEDIYVDGDWDQTIASMIRDEINTAVRAEIKRAIKDEIIKIRLAAQKVAKEAFKEISSIKLQEFAKKAASEL